MSEGVREGGREGGREAGKGEQMVSMKMRRLGCEQREGGREGGREGRSVPWGLVLARSRERKLSCAGM